MGALEVLCRRRGDRDAGAGRSGDRDQLGDGVLGERRTGVPVAADQVADSRGKMSCIFSTIQYDDAGVVSDGLRTTVLPAARAGANFQTDIIIG